MAGFFYGVCNLSVVPVRTEPSDKAEIGTQLLFGDSFTLLDASEDKKWVYIQIAFDQYEGWIDFKQFKPISKDFFELLNTYESPICKDLIGLLQNRNKFIPIMWGSTLPFYKNGTISLEDEVFEFQGQISFPKHNNDPKFLEGIARNYLGAPYLWGGKCHFGIDCSGFVQQVYKFIGCKLPRDANQQAEVGQLVPFDHVQPGDLAYFQNDSGKIIHVGIIMINGQIIHASGEVRIDNFDPKGIFNLSRNVYSHKLSHIRRVLN